MGELYWYKRFPDAALAGFADLSLEECGAYNIVLELIYSREGNLPDHDIEMARLLRCDVRVWRRIRRRLMDLGKLYISGGKLHNGRADREIGNAQTKVALAKQAGIESGAKRRAQKQHGQDVTSGGLRGQGSAHVRRSYMPKLVSDLSPINDLSRTSVRIPFEHKEKKDR